MLYQLDFASSIYLAHRQKLAFSTIPRQLRNILRWYEHLDPTTASAIRSSNDVLESFMPLAAGDGCISIRAAGIGELDIHQADGLILMEVAPCDPVTGETMEPKTCFQAGDRELVTYDREGMAFAARVLRYVNLRYERYHEVPEIEAWWEKCLDQAPCPEWVALREAALKAGHEPPRAIHWMIE